MRNPITLLNILTATSVAAITGLWGQEADDWKIDVGVVTLYQPVSPGIDEYEWRAFPLIDITYRDRYFLNFQKGLGLTLLGNRQSQHQLDVAIGVDFGRDESDAKELTGLGDVDESVELRLFYAFRLNKDWSVNLRLAQGLNNDGHEGFTADLGVNWTQYFPETGILIQTGPSIRFADDDYLNAFYGVTAQQSLLSGYDTYKASAGIESYGWRIFARKQINEQWSLFAQTYLYSLASDAKDSPFITDETQISLLSGISYSF